jgi:hypothetical protein
MIEDDLRIIDLYIADDGRKPIAQFSEEKLAARFIKHSASRIDRYQQVRGPTAMLPSGGDQPVSSIPAEISRQT